jgi:hypothetical protein
MRKRVSRPLPRDQEAQLRYMNNADVPLGPSPREDVSMKTVRAA